MADEDTTHRDVNREPERDLGMTFIEMLVAIVLLGTVGIAVIVALQVTTTASVTDANHARAYVLLHAASDAVFSTDRVPCDASDPLTEDTIIDAYDDEFAPALLQRPEGWQTATPVITKVEFLNASDASGQTVYSWGSVCQEGLTDANGNPTPLKSQKVTIEVTSPDGSLTKVIETVKR